MSTATVLGFGGRTPTEVLHLLSRAVREGGIDTVIPKRSQGMPMALLSAPHRIFLTNNNSKYAPPTEQGKQPQKNLLLYCKPPTSSDYMKFHAEASEVRSAILKIRENANNNNDDDKYDNTVVVVFDPVTSEFLGGTTSTIITALGGGTTNSDDPEGPNDATMARLKLAGAALRALSELDQVVATTQYSPRGPTQRDDVVVVVGSGGREHALAVALAQSPLVGRVVCCPGNGGTAAAGGGGGGKISNATDVHGKQDKATVIDLVKRIGAHTVVVGPEAPLVDGIVDELAIQCPNVKVFGPSKAAAELEASKAFTKDFLQQHGIPTAKYRTFTDVKDALAYVESLDENDRQVVKASGLAAGKGVLIPRTKAETIAAVKEIMSDRAFGSAGDTCVIESFLTGPEASCLAFCDGKTAVLMPAAQDHKRALDGDRGLNTGGMGAYAPAPCVTPSLQAEIETMCIRTIQKMSERGTPYVGCLYAGMMLTPDGPMVLEFNCRFGDPETQVVLPLLETDLYEVVTACCDGTLETVDVRFKEDTSAATVVCAARGYPEKYPKGMRIDGIAEADALDNVTVYHAGTKLGEDGTAHLCSGGRVLAVTGIGQDLKAALRFAYEGVDKVDFISSEGGESLMHHRTDIGKGALGQKLRIGVMGSTRGTALVPVIEACQSAEIHAEIVAVVSNKSSAPILEKGRALGPTVTTKFISSKGLTRDEYDAECTSVLLSAGVEFVLLIGYMRILSKSFTDFWAGRCLNVHPSLLPKHAGGMDLAVHQAVLDAGDVETGCTVHKVTEAVDGGPIVVQKKVKVGKDDTAESLKAKVQPMEGPAFIEAIDKYCKEVGVITYADAGVSIDAGNELVDLIKPACKATRRPGCDADLGGFGGLFDLAAAGYDSAETILIGATDGVGTKLRIAQATQKHESVGIDLVAMCVNDLIVAGGEPLFFLDYYATGRLHVHEAAAVVRGIAEGCLRAGCGLIGGETAEMPSMYSPGDYDLAGFSVGAVHRDHILPKGAQAGDLLLGISSNGIHSNGFSLVRKLIEKEGLTYDSVCPWDSSVSIGDSLLTPTKIYVKSCLPLIKKRLVKGFAHITGGGLLENLPRSLPDDVGAKIDGHPDLPSVFKWIKKASGLDDSEMLRTFNCGVGMVLIVGEDKADAARECLRAAGEDEIYNLGCLVGGSGVTVEQPLK